MSPNLIKIPRYNLNLSTTEEQKSGVDEFLSKNPVAGTKATSFVSDNEIGVVREQVFKYYELLGIDTSDRLCSLDRIHFLGEEDFDKFRDELKYSTNHLGFYSSFYLRIFIKTAIDGKERDKAILFRSLTHELLHSLSYTEIRVLEKGTFIIDKLGFLSGGGGSYIYEGLIDLSVLQIITMFWGNNDILLEYKTKAFEGTVYWKGVIFLDALILFINRKSNHNYFEILNAMQKDAILGTENSFKIFDKYLNGLQMSDLIKIETVEKFDLLGIAEKIGMNEFIAEWIEAKYGQDYKFPKGF